MTKYFRSAKNPAAAGLVSLLMVGGAAAQDKVAATPSGTAPPPQQQSTSVPITPGAPLPEIQVRSKKRARRSSQPAAPAPAPVRTADTQDSRTGTVGVYANSTSVATKVNTPLINVPQSVSDVTKQFIQDTAAQNLTDITRYIPGVAVHQGEGNRDELVIRGVDSSANFFVNGFRDDVQIFRDLYNTQSIEILRGPSALTFGRGAGGGLLNRTLKEADGTRIYEATAQTGSYGDRRFTIDTGQSVTDTVNARLNMMYEGSDTFRDFGTLERYGFNPTLMLKPDENTKVKLSYEYFHDKRTADRGNPSQATTTVAPGSNRFNPASPFAPNGDLSAFFGSPNLNYAQADVHTFMSVIEHDFLNGLTVKNSTLYADYKKFYQNVYPGNGAFSGAVNVTDTAFNRAAYQHHTDRDNAINQTDFVYKTNTGPLLHTLAFGSEFGDQWGIDLRNTGIFPNGTNTLIGDPFSPTYLGSVAFIHQFPGALSPGVTTPDSNSKYNLITQSVYARDTVEITRWLQLIGGVRFDSFHLAATDRNVDIERSRVDDKLSPQAAAIFKPIDNLSIYGAYSVSYLPASGDQFSSLNKGTLIIEPQKFDNREVGLKWNPLPLLTYTAALYDLKRTNVPLADPNNPGFFFVSGQNRIRGAETTLTGYLTKDWQSTLGYSYTDARVTSNTSTTILAGNRVQLVPYNQFSWWNKYQFTPMWAASLGMIYFSDSYAASDDAVRLGGFVRFDAGLFATINQTWRAQLNVENIFNKGYFASADGNNNISPGQPRTFRVAAIARF